MADYIKREDALEAMEWKWAGKSAIEAVKAIPPADVAEIRHGKWEEGCSVCGSWNLCDFDGRSEEHTELQSRI